MQPIRILRISLLRTFNDRIVQKRGMLLAFPCHLLLSKVMVSKLAHRTSIESLTSTFYSSNRFLSNVEVKRSVDQISDNFQEAMELLNDARDSKGTIYFTEDMNEAEIAISKVISDYETLLKALDDEQRRNVIRTIGLKMEELKSQTQMVKEDMKD